MIPDADCSHLLPILVWPHPGECGCRKGRQILLRHCSAGRLQPIDKIMLTTDFLTVPVKPCWRRSLLVRLAAHQEIYQWNSDSRIFIVGDDMWNSKTQCDLPMPGWAFSGGNSNQNWFVFYLECMWGSNQQLKRNRKCPSDIDTFILSGVTFACWGKRRAPRKAILFQGAELKGTILQTRCIVQQPLATLASSFLFKIMPSQQRNKMEISPAFKWSRKSH